jgi:hypothetical protein
MGQSKKINSIRYLEWPVKIVIAALAIWFIYKRIFEKGSAELFSSYKVLFHDSSSLSFILIIVFLMLVNWSLEAWKWKLMIGKIEEVGFFRSLEAVFSGLTVSFFTPNRTGEFAGRIFQLQKADRIKASIITIIENNSQLVMTIVTGSVALIFYLTGYVDMNAYWLAACVVASITIAVASIFLYLNISLLENFFDRFKALKKFHPYIEVFSFYHTKELVRVLLLSFLRFIVFTLQFYLLLQLFGITLSYLPALIMITMIFYVMTLVPTFFITEIAVRGSVAIAFLGALSTNEAGIVNSTVSLWLINIALPALIGSAFVFTFRFRKRRSA